MSLKLMPFFTFQKNSKSNEDHLELPYNSNIIDIFNSLFSDVQLFSQNGYVEAVSNFYSSKVCRMCSSRNNIYFRVNVLTLPNLTTFLEINVIFAICNFIERFWYLKYFRRRRNYFVIVSANLIAFVIRFFIDI